MADALLSLPGRTKVRKTSLPLASTRSFLVKKPPQAPLQQQGEEGVRLKSGSTLREDEFLEELEQQRESHTEGIVLENTYRVAPDPQKKFSPGLFFLLTYLYFILFVKLNINIGFNYLLFGLILA